MIRTFFSSRSTKLPYLRGPETVKTRLTLFPLYRELSIILRKGQHGPFQIGAEDAFPRTLSMREQVRLEPLSLTHMPLLVNKQSVA